MRFHFHTSQHLPYPPELVFAFFANPENLPRLMPGWQRPHIEHATFAPPPPRPEGAPRYPGTAAGNGTRLTLAIRPFPFSPIPIYWEALIEDFRWNEGFCDVQTRGPFQYWRHCHTVTPDHNGTALGTTLNDHVEYELPLGPLSPLANAVFARRALAYTFRYRQRRTVELLAHMTGHQQS